MLYTTSKGKKINIPDKELEKLMSSLEISLEESIDLWLCDHDLEEDDEQNELDEKAKKVKIGGNAQAPKAKTPKKPKTVKISQEKQKIFEDIVQFLAKDYDITIETDNKLLIIHENGKEFKLNLSETRQKK